MPDAQCVTCCRFRHSQKIERFYGSPRFSPTQFRVFAHFHQLSSNMFNVFRNNCVISLYTAFKYCNISRDCPIIGSCEQSGETYSDLVITSQYKEKTHDEFVINSSFESQLSHHKKLLCFYRHVNEGGTALSLSSPLSSSALHFLKLCNMHTANNITICK